MAIDKDNNPISALREIKLHSDFIHLNSCHRGRAEEREAKIQ